MLIKGGTFMMGSPESEPGRYDDEKQHEVTISKPFYMGKHEVTRKEYRALPGTNPSHFKGDDLPVECVSWYDAVEYCNARSRAEGLEPAYEIDKSRKDPDNHSKFDRLKWTVTWDKKADGYRLPTEAEWKYACRAGTTAPFSTGDNITTDQANYDGNFPYNGNAKGKYRGKTTPAGSFAPNPWGLYDMHGNVWDWYDEYPDGPVADPQGAGASPGGDRLFRGGSWLAYGRYLRSAYRGRLAPSSRGDLGFRLVRPQV